MASTIFFGIFMALEHKQTLRILKLLTELKRARPVSARSFAEKLRNEDLNTGSDLACHPKTIQRDIEYLKLHHNAPIEYDKCNQSYRLSDPSWELELPMTEPEFMLHSLLGTKALRELAPQPLKGKMENSGQRASASLPAYISEEFIETLIFASGLKVKISPAIFKTIWEARENNRILRIEYQATDGRKSDREFEPHVLAYHRGIWYLKGYNCSDREVRILAVHRIVSVTALPTTFEFDTDLVADTEKNGLFQYPKLNGIKLRCDKSIAFYLKEHAPVKKFKFTSEENGDLIVTLEAAIEHEVIRWVLGEAGRIEVLEPVELRMKVEDAGKHIAMVNSTSPKS